MFSACRMWCFLCQSFKDISDELTSVVVISGARIWQHIRNFLKWVVPLEFRLHQTKLPFNEKYVEIYKGVVLSNGSKIKWILFGKIHGLNLHQLNQLNHFFLLEDTWWPNLSNVMSCIWHYKNNFGICNNLCNEHMLYQPEYIQSMS
jgi:hypothetical protein